MSHPEIQPIINIRSSRYSKKSVDDVCRPLEKAGMHIRTPIVFSAGSHSHTDDRVISAVVHEAQKKDDGIAFVVFGGDGTWNTVVHRVNEDVKHLGGEDCVTVAFIPRGEMNVNAVKGFQTGEKLLRAIQSEHARRLAYLDLTIDALHTPTRTAMAFITAGWGPSGGLSQRLENIRPPKSNAMLRALKLARSMIGIHNGIHPQWMTMSDREGIFFDGIAAGIEMVNVPNLRDVPWATWVTQSKEVTTFILAGETKPKATKNLLVGALVGVLDPIHENAFLRRVRSKHRGFIDVDTSQGIIFHHDGESVQGERVTHVHVEPKESAVRALVPFYD